MELSSTGDEGLRFEMEEIQLAPESTNAAMRRPIMHLPDVSRICWPWVSKLQAPAHDGTGASALRHLCGHGCPAGLELGLLCELAHLNGVDLFGTHV